MIIGRPNLIHCVHGHVLTHVSLLQKDKKIVEKLGESSNPPTCNFRGNATLWSSMISTRPRQDSWRHTNWVLIFTKVSTLMSFHFPWRQSLSSFTKWSAHSGWVVFSMVDILNIPWVSMDFYGFPWVSIDMPGQKLPFCSFEAPPPTHPSWVRPSKTPRRQWYRDPSSRRECPASTFLWGSMRITK